MESPAFGPATNCNAPDTGLEESVRRLRLEVGDSPPSPSPSAYPERSGAADCKHYVLNGTCGYGEHCRYNHPRSCGVVTGALRSGGGEYPERAGEPVCQYFIKTGYCKYGAMCKYHHPRYGDGSASMVPLNHHGYPLRPDEKECSFYLNTGHCKYGATCKFHHPQPAGISIPAPACAFYPTMQSPLLPSPVILPGLYAQAAYDLMLISPGVTQIPGWTPYPPSTNPVASSVAQQALYGLMHQLSPLAHAYPGPFSSISSSAGPSSSSPKEHMFPERPGERECRYYMKTGDCKYGTSCRYHHPSQWSVLETTCALSPMGLPLRLGTPPCSFYLQHGACKFGPRCKFDHPMGVLSYSPISSLADTPVVPFRVGSPISTLAPASSSPLE